MATVCSGTSCLKETRKPAWMAMPPEMVVRLYLISTAHGKKAEYSHQRRLAHDQVADDVEQICEDVGYHGHEEHELGELVRPPRSFQVASAVEDGESGGDEAEEVLLHHSRQCEDPRIPRHRTAGDDGKPWDAISHADNWLLDLLY